MRDKGCPWFPLYVDMLNSDIRWALFKAEFGNKGFGIAIQLIMQIYQLGYYIEWTNEVALLFCHDVGEKGNNVVSEIVRGMTRRGIFDKGLFERFNILTNKEIQENYLKVVARRKNSEIKKEYLLLCNTQIPKNVNISAGNANISEKMQTFSDREEKSTEEKSREENNTVGGGGRAAISLMENIKGMPLTEYEITRLIDMVDTYSEEWVLDALKIMGDNGKVKISYAEGILKNWQTDGKGKQSGSPFSAEAEAWFNRSDDDGEAGTARV